MKKSKSNKRTKKRGGGDYWNPLSWEIFGTSGTNPVVTPSSTIATQAATVQAVNKSAAGQASPGQSNRVAAGAQSNRVATQPANGSYFGFGGSRRRKPKRKTKKL
jgi:hypothetical protein